MTKQTDRTVSLVALACVSIALSTAAGEAVAYVHNETPNGHPVRWTTDEIHIVIDASVGAIAPVAAVEATIREAFETWIAEADLPMDVTVEPGLCGEPGYHGAKGAQNCVIACADCVPHGEDVGAKALVNHVQETGEIVDADIVLLTDAGDWTMGHTPGAISLEDVALHEVGHVLGLSHSEIKEARMFSSMSTTDEESGSQLHEDDIQGAATLYPDSAPEISTAGCGWRCAAAAGSPREISGCLLFAAAVVLLVLRRRR